MRMEIGSIVTLDENIKEELISHYKSSRGLSGIESNDTNSRFVVRYFDGNNLVVETLLGISYSLHHSRFKLTEVKN